MPVNTTLNGTVQAIINHTAPVQLTANPIPTPIPAGLTTTALDWQPIPVFGVPLWAIIAVLSFAALVIVFLNWSDKSRDLDAIKPWFIKVKELALGKMQVIRLSRAGNFIPDCLNIFDNVLSYGDSEENINQWLLHSPQGVIRIGGISAAIISEDSDHNRDIVTEMAICHAAESLNENIEKLRKELNNRHKKLVDTGEYPEDAENPANLIQPIQNGLDYIGQKNDDTDPIFEKSGRMVLQLLYPDGIHMPAINYFNQNRFRKMWFKGNTSASLGGENLRIVDDEYVKKNDKQKGFFEQYGAMLIAALVFLGCLIGAAAIPLG
ncbi:MAG: hypothetical protein WC626_05380 [Methanoregula sp.]